MTNPQSTFFAPVVKFPDTPKVFDFTEGYDPEYISSFPIGIGRFNERRKGMYKSPIYRNERNIHMGIDFWMAPGSDVFSFYDGRVLFFRDNKHYGDYGPTVVTEHILNDFPLYALYGHLSRMSLNHIREKQFIHKGEKIAEIGTKDENGGWAPHLHFQISLVRPKEPDMPGVVAEKDLEHAMKIYLDPQLVVGKLY